MKSDEETDKQIVLIVALSQGRGAAQGGDKVAKSLERRLACGHTGPRSFSFVPIVFVT